VAIRKAGKFIIDIKKDPYKNAKEELAKKIRDETQTVMTLLRLPEKKKEATTILHYQMKEKKEEEVWIENFSQINKRREKELWEEYFAQKKACNKFKFQKKEEEAKEVQQETNQYQRPQIPEEISIITEGYRKNKWHRWKGSKWKYKVKKNPEKEMLHTMKFRGKKKRIEEYGMPIRKEIRREEKEFVYLINLETKRKKDIQWLIRVTSHFKKKLNQSKEVIISTNHENQNNTKKNISYEGIINRKKKKDWKKFREKEFRYLISLETVRKKVIIWLVRVESHFKSHFKNYKVYQVYEIINYENHLIQYEAEVVKNQKSISSCQNQIISTTQNLVPKNGTKSERREEKENKVNLIEEFIITYHYRCYLYVDSLVQDQFNLRAKTPAGSQIIKHHDSSKAYRRLSSYRYRIETKVEEELRNEETKNPTKNVKSKEEKQSDVVIYLRSYNCHLYVDSLVQDQFNLRVKPPSGSQIIKHHDSPKKEMNRLLIPLGKENNRELENVTKEEPTVELYTGLYQRIRRKLLFVWKRISNFVRRAVKPITLHPPFSEAEEPNFRDKKS
jgi:hypothetical protein